MKKIILKLDLHDDKAKQKAMKTVSTLAGIDSIAMDMKEQKMTVIGIVDPVSVVCKLRKHWHANILTVGPAKELEKKEEPKKEEGKAEVAKTEEPKKEEQKKDGEKKEGEKKEEPKKEGQKNEDEKKKEQPSPPAPDPVMELVKAYRPYYLHADPRMELVKAYRQYNPHMTTNYYVQSMEEDPNACTIC